LALNIKADSKSTILIVDDARVNRELLRMHLGKFGYDIIMAGHGKEAIEQVTEHPEVDLIILDLVMPEMDGFDFLKWRSDQPEIKNIPVIVNSSLDDFDSISKALTMGSYDYFTKPLSMDDLRVVLPLKIKNAVNNRKLMSQISRQNDIMLKELDMAARYQRFLLPEEADVPGAKVTYLFQPCSGVGGDYFDIIELPQGEVALIVADVSGHGLASAMTASIIKALLPNYMANLGSPAKALSALNQDIYNLTQDDMFVTAFAALFSPAKKCLTWALAGHPSPLFMTNKTEISRLSESSIFLGAFDNGSPLVDYQDHVQEIKTGDRLALFTDGLTEAPTAEGEQYGLDRLETMMLAHGQYDIQSFRQALHEDLRAWVNGEFPDDVAFILLDFEL
jgi:serine phosphatase RsbU (regulator of sigma subunit)